MPENPYICQINSKSDFELLINNYKTKDATFLGITFSGLSGHNSISKGLAKAHFLADLKDTSSENLTKKDVYALLEGDLGQRVKAGLKVLGNEAFPSHFTKFVAAIAQEAVASKAAAAAVAYRVRP